MARKDGDWGSIMGQRTPRAWETRDTRSGRSAAGAGERHGWSGWFSVTAGVITDRLSRHCLFWPCFGRERGPTSPNEAHNRPLIWRLTESRVIQLAWTGFTR